MAVMVPRETPTDQRLDALSGQVHALDKKVDTLDRKVDTLDRKVDALDRKVDTLDGQFHALDKKVDVLDGRVGVLEKKVDEGFAGIDKRLDKLTDSLDAHNRTLVAGLFVTVAALIGTSAF
jgi:chaperonin cofactor prefoldin